MKQEETVLLLMLNFVYYQTGEEVASQTRQIAT